MVRSDYLAALNLPSGLSSFHCDLDARVTSLNAKIKKNKKK